MEHVSSEEAYAILEPVVQEAVRRAGAGRFSTKGLIDEMRSSREGEEAYQAALAATQAAGAASHMAHLIVHGQVIPGLLRGSGLVRFAGFIHGDPDHDDGYAVPSWWQRVVE